MQDIPRKLYVLDRIYTLEVSIRRARHGTRGLDVAQLREGRFQVCVSLALDLALAWPVPLRSPLSVAAV